MKFRVKSFGALAKEEAKHNLVIEISKREIATDINVLKLWTKSLKNVGNLGRHLTRATSAKVLTASVRAYAQAMAHIIGTAPIPETA